MLPLTLDEETHTYRLGERVLPSVTQIIKAVGIGYDHTNTNPIHSLRGKAVHKLVELVDNDDLDETTVDPTCRIYLGHYRRFKDDTGFIPIHNELRLASPMDGFACTIDKVGRFPGLGIGILEVKVTESVDEEALKAQLSGQSCAYHANYRRRLKWKYGLQLRRDDPARLITKFSGVTDHYWLGLLDRYRGNA